MLLTLLTLTLYYLKNPYYSKKMKTKPLWAEFAYIKAVSGVFGVLITSLSDYF